jgi:hypothetical protein
MNLSPITTRKESKIAFDALRSCLFAGSNEAERGMTVWKARDSE